VFICEGGLQPIKVQCCAQSLVPGTVREAAGGIKPGVSGANPGERFNPRIVSPRSGGWPWTARTHWAWWEWNIPRFRKRETRAELFTFTRNLCGRICEFAPEWLV